MEFCKIIKHDQIKKISCVRAIGKYEALTSVKNRTGADIVFNAPIFNMTTYQIMSAFTCDHQQCGKGAALWGFRFEDGKAPAWAWNAISAQNFVSEFGLLVVDGKIRNSVSASPLARRGRTAIGITKAGDFVVYVVTDNEAYSKRKTAKALAEKMLSLGCTYAINLDGGGSSQVADRTGVYTSGRLVPGFIAVWLKKDGKEEGKEEDAMSVVATAKTSTFNEHGVRESGRYITKGDVCTIKKTVTDNLLIEVEYPVKTGKRTAYIKTLENFKTM